MQNIINNPILSLFYIAKISRKRNKVNIEEFFKNAYIYNKEETIKLLYYIGDKNGLNERHICIVCYKWLINNDFEMFNKIFSNILLYNRKDILLHFFNTKAETFVLKYIKDTIEQDLNKINNGNNHISNLGKWLPSINSKNQNKQQISIKICRFMNWTPKKYRKNISLLKQNLNIIETKMSKNQWEDIDYTTISSKTLDKYKNAFEKHDKNRFYNFLQTTSNIKEYTKLNELLSSFDITIDKKTRDVNFCLNDNIDKIIPLKNVNYIPVINTSLSMFHSQYLNEQNIPIKLCLILSYYCMKENKTLKNLYFEFNNEATLNEITNLSFDSFVNNLESTIDNINIKNLYNNLLNRLINVNYPTNQLIPNILIITDNSFNTSVNNSFLQEKIYDEMYEKYNKFGYKLPNIIFWNVNSNKCIQQILSNKKGIILLEGYCDDNLDLLSQTNTNTPYELLKVELEKYNI